jgi:16S rRNA processing protein RimM
VHPADTDDPGRFAELARVYVGPSAEAAAPYAVEGVRYQFPAGRVVVLLSLAGVDSREAAEALTNQAVYAAEADLPPLAEDEIYLHDLVGMDVVLAGDDGAPGPVLGRVVDVQDAAAQTLFVVAREGAPHVLLPDVEEFVVGVDEENRRLLVRPPEGLYE